MRGLFGSDTPDDAFDERGAFVPEHLPTPGPFLDGRDLRVLTGDDHVAVHETARKLFEERGVYDVTFGYNLARLNHDQRHPDAGFRYAEESESASVSEPKSESGSGAGDVLRAEFTPTTEFCPQGDTLTVGAFRAWNGLAERHGYDLVRIRVAPSHQRATAVNAKLERLEEQFVETGELPDERDGVENETRSRGDADAPF